MNQLKVYEMRLKIYLLQDISQEQTYAVFANYIDSCLAKNESLLELHETNCYKQYCFDQPYPLEKDGIYKEGIRGCSATGPPVPARFPACGAARPFPEHPP